MSDDDRKQEWHTDRRITIALIVTIIINTGGIVWWASAMDRRMAVVEETLPLLQPRTLCLEQHKTLERDIHHVEQLNQGVNARLGRIEDKLDSLFSLFVGNGKGD